ncbi:TPA: hypothetical protein DDW69_02425 [candidate division CPR2 bacterium]|uniref:Uncharacterized protein n=1 Tax=candidate division CPR2 bacterium GW2011_GWC1_41_48 TaxID=1618344 RepID=A0A0G0WCT6_UNCC2|nr:MAG: hypothetical protein UT47_C0001G0287 [candidate division CPR2 bacterium GW2011_GWC2_39_35]KKR27630.1 MAG: hypothetical protein UT59_C0051G0011 [candidate division CPR2 bacterium GW2011_GWD1_39_7]KKR28839.1 MAG: hypothetical protein UT60_C0011G0005 [candidate division CPR2 bacterium GW2011_GWD2_39_7]KKS09882.1 MAG: hypothetical protein UU65_C0001G0287 [candidate division CPR2 bacterium GW2011_GWC1_41_48]OGB59452.1 MAG: hypothetical protein A2Y27_03875 [candidate division CPR2 bacterium G
MNSDEAVKIVVFVPETHANVVREAMGKAGAGLIGNYKYCSFSVKGTGRFLPLKGANPSIGEVGRLEEVAEERIETVCFKKNLDKVIRAINKVHPYEEIALDVYPLILDPHETTYKKREE